ncbi:hypothetical protein Mboo_0668 [Methanoregula boonei 6A8]|jgi:hypothetical protein|uniref:Uncharacterized protein n=1 Tax=Methanoregula boonei (strain DSM 21154 / JCM 14090 / 6A8) TaxID=456442 RepID=A7I625_METB6|nr:hypothetical protein [Methanoregula boonei]ABS55186.1 hypothetical protein Mboo_0668 [Methanoregula boonei 6A8]
MPNKGIVQTEPLDNLIDQWNKTIEEISEIPLSLNRANRYRHKLEADLIKFGWNDNNYSKYTEEEKNRKMDELRTRLCLAVDKSINLYDSREHEREIDKLKNKKGIFDNATITFENFLNLFNFSKK